MDSKSNRGRLRPPQKHFAFEIRNPGQEQAWVLMGRVKKTENQTTPSAEQARESSDLPSLRNARKQLLEDLRERVKEFPQSPGVYLMRGTQQKILYVGKAKNLKARVRSYLSATAELPVKTRYLVGHIENIEYILTNTEVEAFLLEASLIKKHRPRYNIRLKDDKAYPYIKLTAHEPYPRLYLSRKVKKDGALYFGPYASGQAVHGTIRFLNQTFRVRDCSDSFMRSRKRPCITHQIGRCTAPCVDLVSAEEYRSDIDHVVKFLRGKNKKLIGELNQQMKQAAEAERFEAAAKLRDSIKAIEEIQEKQAVVSESERDQDVFGYCGDERGTMIESLHLRQGRLIGHRSHLINQLNAADELEDPREWLTSFINQYYDDNVVPDEVLLPLDLGADLFKLLTSVLRERGGHACEVKFPTDPAGHHLLEMAESNARSRFQEFVAKSDARRLALETIQEKLALPTLPWRIECFDISNFQGGEIVASQVVFEDGQPAREHYRRYKIRSITEGPDDFGSMREVLRRRLAHTEYEEPQLIVVDGGKGQLNAAVEILRELGRAIPLVGIAKDRVTGHFSEAEVGAKGERFFIPGRQNPILFASNSEALHILVGIRDEAHRFAISYHRKLREVASLESELDAVVGLGEKRKRILLRQFADVQAVCAAAVEEIAKLPTFNRVLAERILLQLNEAGDNGEPEVTAQ